MHRFADVSYFVHRKKTQDQIDKSIGNAYSYTHYLKQYYSVVSILHADNCSQITSEKYKCFSGSGLFWWLPNQTHDFLNTDKPDIVLVQGFVFPVQVLLLRLTIGPKAVIILQYHGERPFRNPVKRWLQKLANKYIDGYFFTSAESAMEWREAGIIRDEHKCYEVLGSSTEFKKLGKAEARTALGINQDLIFLSVGRLNANKDPLAILSGFEKYLNVQPSASLYMIFQTNEMLEKVSQRIQQSKVLSRAVKLVGEVKNQDLQLWYSASDFYISGSHREATGFALIEAMACGCIPVVTNIPSFRKITADGKYALLFEPGNSESLFRALGSTLEIDINTFSNNIQAHFKHFLSFERIAQDIRNIGDALLTRKSPDDKLSLRNDT